MEHVPPQPAPAPADPAEVRRRALLEPIRTRLQALGVLATFGCLELGYDYDDRMPHGTTGLRSTLAAGNAPWSASERAGPG